MSLSTVPTGIKVAVLVFMLFYLVSLARTWFRAWTRPADELLALAGRFGSPYLTPLRWLEDRPRTWLWLHRVSVTLGLLIAIVAVVGLLLNLMGVLG